MPTQLLSDLYLRLDSCPHCKTDAPALEAVSHQPDQTTDSLGNRRRYWKRFRCRRCGGVILAGAEPPAEAPTQYHLHEFGFEITEIYPPPNGLLSDDLPERAKTYLAEAVRAAETSPNAATVAAASAVDAMLKTKGLREGSLFLRIQTATQQHIITPEMELWAHDVRLDANDQRHADDNVPLATSTDARRCCEFALALGEYLLVLPARVKRAREKLGAQPGKPPGPGG